MEISNWESFIRYLENNVDWDNENYDEESPKVEYALREIAKFPEAIEERGRQILEDSNLFKEFKPHCNYPRTIMDKFMLHMDGEDRFRVRIHRFKTKIQNGESKDRPHQHKWPMTSLILKGSYEENQYSISALDEETGYAKLELKQKKMYRAGEVNTMTIHDVHQVLCDSTEPAISLFVRGRSFSKASRIFPLGENRYYDTFDPDKQLRVGYENITKLNTNFH